MILIYLFQSKISILVARLIDECRIWGWVSRSFTIFEKIREEAHRTIVNAVHNFVNAVNKILKNCERRSQFFLENF